MGRLVPDQVARADHGEGAWLDLKKNLDKVWRQVSQDGNVHRAYR